MDTTTAADVEKVLGVDLGTNSIGWSLVEMNGRPSLPATQILRDLAEH